jgi:hypothetical protein
MRFSLVACAAVLASSLRGEGEGGDAQADPATQETIQVGTGHLTMQVTKQCCGSGIWDPVLFLSLDPVSGMEKNPGSG